ncbi:hypothetical protein MCAP1_003453 [Malassezia caprae]|uniref:UPF3 domain-containing protein n=1 Tax=Malassezia caprae TaxID=1381934 RepID=A0AAF0E7G1_9BASI|nr:hypothetical protein MCAP1_003453 [Malassezia caprae]
MGGKPRGGAAPPRRKPRKPRRKIVVRDLPPHLPAGVFWSTVSPWVRIAAGTPSTEGAQPVRAATDQTATVVYAEPTEHDTPSTAYLQFRQTDQLLAFAKAFHGHRFQDTQGHEYVALVDYALIQQAPTTRPPRADPLAGTIEQTPEFQAFVASLEAPPTPSAPPEAAPSSTHLVDYLRAQDEQARARKAKKAPKRAEKKRADAQPEARTPGVLPRPAARPPRPPLAPGTLPAPSAPKGKPKGKPKGPKATPRPPRQA